VVAAAEPVTVTVARDVRADQREAFERWAAEVLGWPRSSRATWAPACCARARLDPLPPGLPFADGESLARWERSTERRAALQRVEHLTDRVDYAHVAGLDSFFTALTPPGRAPLADDRPHRGRRLRHHAGLPAAGGAARDELAAGPCGCCCRR
jgi:hypothetical protein